MSPNIVLLIELGRNALVASRPTDLQITFSDSSHHSCPDVVQTQVLSSLKRTVVERVLGLSHTPKPVSPTAKLAQLKLHAMPLLTRIRSLHFRCDTGRSDADASVIFPELLRVVGNRLRALHIEFPFTMHLSQAPRLEFLETFTLDIHPYHPSQDHKTAVEKVPAFLLAHKFTLRNVSFTITDGAFDVLPILRCLQLIPCLYSISLSFPYDVMPTTVVHSWQDMLETHRQHLRSLSLSFTTTSAIQVPAFFHRKGCFLQLPNLTNLAIYMHGVPFVRIHLEIYFQPFSSSLVSLDIRHPLSPGHHTRDKFRRFCKILSHFTYLQDLSLTNYGPFHPTDLVIFASSLPHLLFLFIECFNSPSLKVSCL